MMSKSVLYRFVFLFSLLLQAFILQANQIYVSTTGNDNNNGRTLTTAVKSFAKALSMVRPTTTEIVIASGTYLENNVAILNSAAPKLIISGESASNTIIRMNAFGRRILKTESNYHNSSNYLIIRNITFVNGNPVGGSGGAITFSQAGVHRNDLTLENVVFDSNRVTSTGKAGASSGGAIAFSGNRLVINNCYFKNNKALPSADLPASAGGAIHISPATGGLAEGVFVEIMNTTFEGNEANQKGGAIHLINVGKRPENATASYLKLTNCTFVDNKVCIQPTFEKQMPSFGSALSLVTTTENERYLFDFTITNSTFFNNFGGSVRGSAQIAEQKSTIQIDGKQWKALRLVNNIVMPPSTANVGFAIQSNQPSAGKLSGRANIIESIGKNVQSPSFRSKRDNTENLLGSVPDLNLSATLTNESNKKEFKVPYLKLNPGSKAINFGVNSFGSPNVVPEKDIRGRAKMGTSKDVGAYEFEE